MWRMAPPTSLGQTVRGLSLFVQRRWGLDGGAGALMKAKGDGRGLPALAGRPQ